MDSEKRLADMQFLIDEFKRSGLRELQARHGDFEIYLSQDADAPGLGGRAVPCGAGAAQRASCCGTGSGFRCGSRRNFAHIASALPAGAMMVCAPYLGTFYRSPKPGAALCGDWQHGQC